MSQNWSFIAAGTVATGANPSPALPAGYKIGDKLILVAIEGNTAFTSVPGYTQAALYNSSGLPATGVWWRDASSSETAPTVTNATASSIAVLLAYRGLIPGTIDAVSAVANTGSGNSGLASATIVTSAANDCVIHVWGSVSGGTYTWTGPGSPTTTEVNQSSSSTLSGTFICDVDQAIAGTTTSRSASVSSSIGITAVSLAFLQLTLPYVAIQPQSQSSIVGSTATFTVTGVSSGGTLSYQWQQWISGSWSNVGTNSSSYTTGTLTQADNGDLFNVIITDNNGSATSNTALLYVTGVASAAWLT